LHLGWFTSFAQNLHDVVVTQNFIIELRPRSFSELASPLVQETRPTAARDPPSRSPPAAAEALQQAPLPAAGVAARPAAAPYPRAPCGPAAGALHGPPPTAAIAEHQPPPAAAIAASARAIRAAGSRSAPGSLDYRGE